MYSICTLTNLVVRILSGSCFASSSNVIRISNKAFDLFASILTPTLRLFNIFPMVSLLVSISFRVLTSLQVYVVISNFHFWSIWGLCRWGYRVLLLLARGRHYGRSPSHSKSSETNVTNLTDPIDLEEKGNTYTKNFNLTQEDKFSKELKFSISSRRLTVTIMITSWRRRSPVVLHSSSALNSAAILL